MSTTDDLEYEIRAEFDDSEKEWVEREQEEEAQLLEQERAELERAENERLAVEEQPTLDFLRGAFLAAGSRQEVAVLLPCLGDWGCDANAEKSPHAAGGGARPGVVAITTAEIGRMRTGE